MQKVNNRIVETESGFCAFCGKTISFGYVQALNCNATCNRYRLYWLESFNAEKKIDKDCKRTYAKFKKYLLTMIDTEPMIYYKEWEIRLRRKLKYKINGIETAIVPTLPREIEKLIAKKQPLPRPNSEGNGLPSIIISKKEELIYVF